MIKSITLSTPVSTISITNVLPYESGLSFDVTDSADECTDAYRTNQHGEGLWKNGKQIIGNTQFALSADASRSVIKRKLEKVFCS